MSEPSMVEMLAAVQHFRAEGERYGYTGEMLGSYYRAKLRQWVDDHNRPLLVAPEPIAKPPAVKPTEYTVDQVQAAIENLKVARAPVAERTYDESEAPAEAWSLPNDEIPF